ncbi:MAG: chemotaxis protein CheD [Roseburia sp.]|nr:chemotaxis protein CheD [Roseburia sp.]
MSEMVRVGMADYKLCRPPQKISTLGLGSCLGVILYDNMTKLCGMAHVMLPDSTQITKNKNRMKFMDTCLPDMYEEMLREGALPAAMIAKIAGGAQMFSAKPQQDMLHIGQHNVAAAKEILAGWGIPIVSEDVGGCCGRTIEFDTVTGELNIKTVGLGDNVI